MQAKLNGMPMLIVERGDTTMMVADVLQGDKDKLVELADALIPVEKE